MCGLVIYIITISWMSLWIPPESLCASNGNGMKINFFIRKKVRRNLRLHGRNLNGSGMHIRGLGKWNLRGES